MQRNEFDSIKIGLASPEMIREWSYGEETRVMMPKHCLELQKLDQKEHIYLSVP